MLMAWRSLRFFSACSGVSPLPTTGSSQLNPMYQLAVSTVVGRRMPCSRYCLALSWLSPAATSMATPYSPRSICGTS
ncbi:hypothetical protein D3C73_980310 [compost metagenome]